MARAGLPLREVGEAWRIAVSSEAGVDSALAAMAQWLRENNRVAAWRDELLPVTDAVGTAAGRIERAAVRPLGIATQAVHLVATDTRGQVWVQQRAFDKATDPGLWDTTMGGLVSAGESIAQTLARETWEEAGLRVADLAGMAAMGRLTVRRPVAEGYMVEHIAMFEAVIPDGQVPVNQDGEVERFELMPVAQALALAAGDTMTVDAALVTLDFGLRHGLLAPPPGAAALFETA